MRHLFHLIVVGLLLSACAPSTPTIAPVEVVVVTNGETAQQYTVEELRALPATAVEREGDIYTGILMRELLADAGYEWHDVLTVEAVASDDYSWTYDADLLARDDFILAYARGEGGEAPVGPEHGPTHTILPGEQGRMNVRMVVELVVTLQ